MPINFGRRHGNGYHKNRGQKITITPIPNLKKYLVSRVGPDGKRFNIEVFMFKLRRTDIVLKLIWEGEY